LDHKWEVVYFGTGGRENLAKAVGSRLTSYGVPAYFRMKPTGESTPFPTSALGFRSDFQCIIGVVRGGGCIGLGEQSQKSFGRRLQI